MISARHPFVGLPLLVSFIGLVAGFAAASVLPKLRRRNEEAAIIAAARRAKGFSGQQSTDLQTTLLAWSAAARRAGLDAATRFDVVDELAAEAAGRAATARATLAEALAASPNHPDGRRVLPDAFRAEALAQSTRASMEWSDFVDREGKRVDHPAAELAGEVQGIADLGHELANHEDHFAGRSSEIDALLELARRTFDTSTKLDASRFDAYLASVRDAVGAPAPEVFEPHGARIDSGPAKRKVGLAILNGLVIAIAIGTALVSLAFAIWQPTATFGTAADYYKLSAAAVAAGGAASIVALVDSWSRPKAVD